jgi:hypothetical protein
MGYLSDRFNQPVKGLTQTELDVLLTQKRVPPSLIKQIKELLYLSEMGRYAPGIGPDVTPDEMYKNTRQLISRLEKVIA